MKLLRSYLLREHTAPFFVTLGGLTAVLLVGNIIKFAELVIAKGVSVFDVLRLLIYLIPFMLTFTIPMACLIAMVLAFGRLSGDYELIAIRASGVAPIRLVYPMLVVGLLISLLLLISNDRVVPASRLAFRRQLKTIGMKQPTAYLEPGTFIKDFPPYILFVYQVENQKLYNVRIYEPQPNGPTRTIIADWGEFERLSSKRGVQLVLHDGTVDETDPQHPGSFYKVTFTTYAMTLRSDQDDPSKLRKKIREMTFKELNEERRRLRTEGVETLPITLELNQRIANPFATLIFVAFGLALGLRLHHHERLTSFAWVLGLFVIYYLASIGVNAIVMKGWLAPSLAIWLPNLIGGAIGAGLVYRAVSQ